MIGTARDRANRWFTAVEQVRVGEMRISYEEVIGSGFCVGRADDGGARCRGRPFACAALQGAAVDRCAVPYDWSGFYLGINGGGGWGHSNWSANDTGFGVNGGQVGGTFGYNRQLGNFVFGVEGDIDWSGLNGTGTSVGCPGGCSTSETWLSTVRGRIGYSFDRVMPYATGGLAVGDIRAAMPGFSGGTSTNAGWTLGGGVELRCRATGPRRPSICGSTWVISIAPAARRRRPAMSRSRRTSFAPAELPFWLGKIASFIDFG